MYNLLKAEIYKLKYDKLLIIISVMILLFGLNNFGLQNAADGRTAFLQETRDYLALFALAAYAGMSIGSNFSDRTIQKLVIAGHQRSSVLLSKLMSYFISCFILYMICVLVIVLPYTITRGWGAPVTVNEAGMIFSTLLISYLFHLCSAGIMFFISFWIKETGIATAVCLFVMLVFVLVSDSASVTAGYVAYALSGGDTLSQQLIIQTCLFSLVKMCLSISATYIMFRKAELK